MNTSTISAVASTLFILTDWEINGYDDSDFMCSYYDSVKNTVEFHCYGSTRFPSSTIIGWTGDVSSVVVNGMNLVKPTAEIVEAARKVLAGMIAAKLTATAAAPGVASIKPGVKVQLTRGCKMRATTSTVCDKCTGSGHWVNPRNASDKRACFACNGNGSKETKAAGWVKLEAGKTGTVVSSSEYRGSVTVVMVSDSGERFQANLDAISLVVSEEQIAATAEAQSRDLEFSRMARRHAWDCSNFARQVARQAA